MRENQFRYHTMGEVDKRGWDAVVEDVIKEANDGPEYIYISFDIDVIDPAYMSGTGTPEPGGITNRQAFRLLRRLCAESNVIGIDILELAPERGDADHRPPEVTQRAHKQKPGLRPGR